jgi:hypothetical protein
MKIMVLIIKLGGEKEGGKKKLSNNRLYSIKQLCRNYLFLFTAQAALPKCFSLTHYTRKRL